MRIPTPRARFGPMGPRKAGYVRKRGRTEEDWPAAELPRAPGCLTGQGCQGNTDPSRTRIPTLRARQLSNTDPSRTQYRPQAHENTDPSRTRIPTPRARE